MIANYRKHGEQKYIRKNSGRFINTVKNRFYAKVLIPNNDGCMLWAGCLTPKGYGSFRVKGKDTHASRFSYLLHCGNIPKNLCICHKCDNPACVSPEHLFIGTQKQNVMDMIKKNRQNYAKGSKIGLSKLNEEKVKNIKNLIGEKKLSLSEVSKIFNVSIRNIYKILQGKIWRHVS